MATPSIAVSPPDPVTMSAVSNVSLKCRRTVTKEQKCSNRFSSGRLAIPCSVENSFSRDSVMRSIMGSASGEKWARYLEDHRTPPK